MPTAERIDRYLRITRWARRRYSYRDSAGRRMLVTLYRGKPTRYSRLEAAAARRYLGLVPNDAAA